MAPELLSNRSTNQSPLNPGAEASPRAGESGSARSVLISPVGKGFRLNTAMWLPRPINEIFAFFADAGNLDLLTPERVRFRIVTPLPIIMRHGALIDYRLRLRGIPASWQSEITAWEPPFRFVDEQRRGPYRRWVHEHRFSERDGGTEVCDQVDYAVTGGRLVHKMLVAPDLQAIFEFRQRKLMEIFAGKD